MNINTIVKVAVAIVCLVGLSACKSQKFSTQIKEEVRWPDFLRDWADSSRITDARRLAIINQIDTLYLLTEDSTADNRQVCDFLCRTQDTLRDIIVHDTSYVFTQMMRATARNLYGVIYRNPWLLRRECSCEAMDYLLIDPLWNTSSGEVTDIMYTSLFGLSWEVPDRYAVLMLAKSDASQKPTLAVILLADYIDTVIENITITFTDSHNDTLYLLNEEDLYIPSTEMYDGTLQFLLPPFLLMEALASGGTMTIAYDTPHGRIEMIGYPHITFLEQIEDCPRLKQVLIQAIEEE